MRPSPEPELVAALRRAAPPAAISRTPTTPAASSAVRLPQAPALAELAELELAR